MLKSFRESEYGTEEIAESVKEEKKRKQMEAIAEDLFIYEKVWMHFIDRASKQIVDHLSGVNIFLFYFTGVGATKGYRWWISSRALFSQVIWKSDKL